VPIVVVGDFASPDAASSYITLGAARVLPKPVSPDTLQRTVVELRAQTAEPRTGREPLGELSVEALADRISSEVRRGLLEAVEPGSRGTSVGFGDGADVLAAVWGAVARVRELVTLRSSGAVRFDSSGPEGAVPFAAWSGEDRRIGERGAAGGEAREGDGVALQGRRIVIADDDPAVVWFMSGLLKALGAEVLEAHDGARALALTYDHWPDLVVSDVLMPKLDGFSLCHEIKRDVAVRDTPVILLSWKEDLLQRVRELGASADGYLRKEAAAATVAERLREVLRPRARVEQRIASGSDARGRLDGLTPRLVLELASKGERDVRVSIRDAVYLYEVQIRRGRLCSATRSSAEGSFERGEMVLGALLGASAGRFVVEPDVSPCRSDFEGTLTRILKPPIERARRALNSISAGALVGVTRVNIALPAIEGYLNCTPEPARSLMQKIIAGASPRDLITSGEIAPRLLEAVLSDAARRGGVLDVERTGSEPAPLRGSLPPVSVSLLPRPLSSAPVAPEITEEDKGWFSFQLDSGTPAEAAERRADPELSVPPIAVQPEPSVSATAAKSEVAIASLNDAATNATSSAPPPSRPMPFSAELTPAKEKLPDPLTDGVFGDASTLQGVGLPAVNQAAPAPEPPRSPSAPAAAPVPPRPAQSADKSSENDGLAAALTAESPAAPPVTALGGTVIMSPPATSASDKPPPPAVAPVKAAAMPAEAAPAVVASTKVAAAKVANKVSPAGPAKAQPKAAAPVQAAASASPRSGVGAWTFIVLLVVAFAAAYAGVSSLRGSAPAAPLPGSGSVATPPSK